jgi:hypothetical protein
MYLIYFKLIRLFQMKIKQTKETFRNRWIYFNWFLVDKGFWLIVQNQIICKLHCIT